MKINLITSVPSSVEVFTKLDYYAAYLHMRVLHFNAAECGVFTDYSEHYAASQAVENMCQSLSLEEISSVEAEVDEIFAHNDTADSSL